MKNRIGLLVAMVWLALCAEIHAQSKPNIVLILADDLRADALGCYGNTHVKTPHIDKLAQSGTRFSNAYIVGGDQGAICSPSRAMLLTGKNYFRISNKVKGERTLPKVLKENGYQTYVTGKWHNEKEGVVEGFTQAKNVMFGGMDDHFQTPMQDMKADGTFTEIQRKGFSTDVFTETALGFIDQQARTKPFFLYLPFTAPHDPRSPKAEYQTMYDAKNIPLPPNFMELHPFSFGYPMGGRDEFLNPFPRTPEMIRAQLADYYGLISHLDESVGKILDKLRQKGLDKNTIVVFAADNGLAIGSHGLMGKQNLYEHSMKVPMIIAGPGLPKGKTVDGFAYLLDIFPTLCGQLNIKSPENIDGKSLNDLIHGKSIAVRSEILTAYLQHQRSIRNERYKLIRFPSIDYQLLFDLKNDTHERVNLAEKPDYQSVVDELSKLLQQKQKEFGDTLPLKASVIQPREWDYRQLQRVPDKSQPPYVLEKYFK